MGTLPGLMGTLLLAQLLSPGAVHAVQEQKPTLAFSDGKFIGQVPKAKNGSCLPATFHLRAAGTNTSIVMPATADGEKCAVLIDPAVFHFGLQATPNTPIGSTPYPFGAGYRSWIELDNGFKSPQLKLKNSCNAENCVLAIITAEKN